MGLTKEELKVLEDIVHNDNCDNWVCSESPLSNRKNFKGLCNEYILF